MLDTAGRHAAPSPVVGGSSADVMDLRDGMQRFHQGSGGRASGVMDLRDGMQRFYAEQGEATVRPVDAHDGMQRFYQGSGRRTAGVMDIRDGMQRFYANGGGHRGHDRRRVPLLAGTRSYARGFQKPHQE